MTTMNISGMAPTDIHLTTCGPWQNLWTSLPYYLLTFKQQFLLLFFVDGQNTWTVLASSGPKTCEPEPFETTDDEETCNPYGSERNGFFDKENKVCKCKEGFFGQYCNNCHPLNEALEKKNCSCEYHQSLAAVTLCNQSHLKSTSPKPTDSFNSCFQLLIMLL